MAYLHHVCRSCARFFSNDTGRAWSATANGGHTTGQSVNETFCRYGNLVESSFSEKMIFVRYSDQEGAINAFCNEKDNFDIRIPREKNDPRHVIKANGPGGQPRVSSGGKSRILDYAKDKSSDVEVFFGNLPLHYTAQDIRRMAEKTCVNVLDVKMPRSDNKRFGFALVTNQEDVDKLVSTYHNQFMDGHTIVVQEGYKKGGVVNKSPEDKLILQSMTRDSEPYDQRRKDNNQRFSGDSKRIDQRGRDSNQRFSHNGQRNNPDAARQVNGNHAIEDSLDGDDMPPLESINDDDMDYNCGPQEFYSQNQQATSPVGGAVEDVRRVEHSRSMSHHSPEAPTNKHRPSVEPLMNIPSPANRPIGQQNKETKTSMHRSSQERLMNNPSPANRPGGQQFGQQCINFKKDSGSGSHDTYELFVANFPFHTTVEELLELFAEYGATGCLVKNTEDTTRGAWALIQFLNQDDANRAIKNLKFICFKGRRLDVKWDARCPNFVPGITAEKQEKSDRSANTKPNKVEESERDIRSPKSDPVPSGKSVLRSSGGTQEESLLEVPPDGSDTRRIICDPEGDLLTIQVTTEGSDNGSMPDLERIPPDDQSEIACTVVMQGQEDDREVNCEGVDQPRETRPQVGQYKQAPQSIGDQEEEDEHVTVFEYDEEQDLYYDEEGNPHIYNAEDGLYYRCDDLDDEEDYRDDYYDPGPYPDPYNRPPPGAPAWNPQPYGYPGGRPSFPGDYHSYGPGPYGPPRPRYGMGPHPLMGPPHRQQGLFPRPHPRPRGGFQHQRFPVYNPRVPGMNHWNTGPGLLGDAPRGYPPQHVHAPVSSKKEYIDKKPLNIQRMSGDLPVNHMTQPVHSPVSNEKQHAEMVKQQLEMVTELMKSPKKTSPQSQGNQQSTSTPPSSQPNKQPISTRQNKQPKAFTPSQPNRQTKVSTPSKSNRHSKTTPPRSQQKRKQNSVPSPKQATPYVNRAQADGDDGPPPLEDADVPPPLEDDDGPPPLEDDDGPPPLEDDDGPPPLENADGPPPLENADGLPSLEKALDDINIGGRIIQQVSAPNHPQKGGSATPAAEGASLRDQSPVAPPKDPAVLTSSHEKKFPLRMRRSSLLHMMLDTCPTSGLVIDNDVPDTFAVMVTHVEPEDSRYFWAQICTSPFIEGVQELAGLNQYLQEKPPSQRTQSTRGVAMYEGEWARVWVCSGKGDQVMVLYVDYGNTQEIPYCDIMDLPDEKWLLPPQAVPFRLQGSEEKVTPFTTPTLVKVGPASGEETIIEVKLAQ